MSANKHYIQDEKNKDKPKKIFISYSTKDEWFKDLLVYYLRAFEVRGEMDIWVDDRLADELRIFIENERRNTSGRGISPESFLSVASDFDLDEEAKNDLEQWLTGQREKIQDKVNHFLKSIETINDANTGVEYASQFFKNLKQQISFNQLLLHKGGTVKAKPISHDQTNNQVFEEKLMPCLVQMAVKSWLEGLQEQKDIKDPAQEQNKLKEISSLIESVKKAGIDNQWFLSLLERMEEIQRSRALLEEQITWEINNADMYIIILSNNYFESEYAYKKERELIKARLESNRSNVVTVLASNLQLDDKVNKSYEHLKSEGFPIESLLEYPIDNNDGKGADTQLKYKYMTDLVDKFYVAFNKINKSRNSDFDSFRQYYFHKTDKAKEQNKGKEKSNGLSELAAKYPQLSRLYAIVSLQFHHVDINTYRLEFRRNSSEQYIEHPLLKFELNINLKALRRFKKLDNYGKCLSESLFGTQDGTNMDCERLRKEFCDAVELADKERIPLRLRIMIGPSAQELNEVNWETLLMPVKNCAGKYGRPLVNRKFIWFSRFLMSQDLGWTKVEQRVAIKPSSMALFSCCKKGGLQTAQESLRLARESNEGHMLPPEDRELDTLKVELQKKHTWDVLHIVGFVDSDSSDKPRLLGVDREDQKSFNIEAIRDAISAMSTKPRLVVLQPTNSKNTRSKNLENEYERICGNPGLVRLAQGFLQGGVACVLTFQSPISQVHLEKFLNKFYDRLLKTEGHIGASVFDARRAIISEDENAKMNFDWDSPVLIARQKTTRMWYNSDFELYSTQSLVRASMDEDDNIAEQDQEVKKDALWNSLATAIENKKVLPIIGPRIFQKIIPSRDEIALKLADKFHYPMAYNERAKMTQVARYVSSNFGYPVLNNQYDIALAELISKDHPDKVERALETIGVDHFCDLKFDNTPGSCNIDDFIENVANQLFDECQYTDSGSLKGPREAAVFHQLAKLDSAQYLTTSACQILELAIKKWTQKSVEAKSHPWRISMLQGDLSNDDVTFDDQKQESEQGNFKRLDKELTKEEVEVYHLFGENTPWYTRVLPEDDFFKFLRSLDRKSTRNRDEFAELKQKFLTHDLLLLGFGLNDWEFRILMQLINSVRENSGLYYASESDNKIKEKSDKRRFRTKIAVQLTPDDDMIMDPYRAKEYLGKFLDQRNITVFWGSEEDFLDKLDNARAVLKEKEG